ASLVPELVTERTKAILPVELAGQPCDLDPLLALGIPVVEDAAHAFESVYRGRKVGVVADATCFSLYATKNIAAGEGGLVSTNRAEVAEAVDDLRLMRRGPGRLYDIVVPGYKANLSDVLAAIALCQLDKVDRHRELRRRQFELYDGAVAGLEGIEPLARDPRDIHALHLSAVRIGSVVVTGLFIAYLAWKIDLHRTGHILANANVGYFVASAALMIVSVWPMAWRWQRLLEARAIGERLGWLTRTYFVSYTVGQVL